MLHFLRYVWQQNSFRFNEACTEIGREQLHPQRTVKQVEESILMANPNWKSTWKGRKPGEGYSRIRLVLSSQYNSEINDKCLSVDRRRN